MPREACGARLRWLSLSTAQRLLRALEEPSVPCCPPGSAPRGSKPGRKGWRVLEVVCPPGSPAPSSSSLMHGPSLCFSRAPTSPVCRRGCGSLLLAPRAGMLRAPGCCMHRDAACTSGPQARCHAPGSALLLFSSSSNMYHPLLSKKDFLPFFKGKAEIFISPTLCLPQSR